MNLRNLWMIGLLAGCPTPNDPDADLDGFTAADDCDDSDPNVNPSADEVCDNNKDDDCDGVTDDDGVGASIFYLDDDGDTYGDQGTSQRACTAPDTYVPNDDDCDDGNADIHPGVEDDNCDGVDDDCDGSVDEQSPDITVYVDADDDGFGAGDAETACKVEDGYSDNADDCNDGDDGIYPDAPERCNGLDDDCDTTTDEGVLGSGAMCPAEHCAAILTDQPGATDGTYWISFDEAHELTCDMSEGGFTVFTGEDLRELDLVRFSLRDGLAGDYDASWLGAEGTGTIVLHPQRANISRTDCNTAVLRASAELPFEFEEWRGEMSVRYWGQDNTADAGSKISDCGKGAFSFGSGFTAVKEPGTWGEGGVDVRNAISWSAEDLGASRKTFFWEINGYTTAFTPLPGEESALVETIVIAVK